MQGLVGQGGNSVNVDNQRTPGPSDAPEETAGPGVLSVNRSPLLGTLSGPRGALTAGKPIIRQNFSDSSWT